MWGGQLSGLNRLLELTASIAIVAARDVGKKKMPHPPKQTLGVCRMPDLTAVCHWGLFQAISNPGGAGGVAKSDGRAVHRPCMSETRASAGAFAWGHSDDATSGQQKAWRLSSWRGSLIIIPSLWRGVWVSFSLDTGRLCEGGARRTKCTTRYYSDDRKIICAPSLAWRSDAYRAASISPGNNVDRDTVTAIAQGRGPPTGGSCWSPFRRCVWRGPDLGARSKQCVAVCRGAFVSCRCCNRGPKRTITIPLRAKPVLGPKSILLRPSSWTIFSSIPLLPLSPLSI